MQRESRRDCTASTSLSARARAPTPRVLSSFRTLAAGCALRDTWTQQRQKHRHKREREPPRAPLQRAAASQEPGAGTPGCPGWAQDTEKLRAGRWNRQANGISGGQVRGRNGAVEGSVLINITSHTRSLDNIGPRFSPHCMRRYSLAVTLSALYLWRFSLSSACVSTTKSRALSRTPPGFTAYVRTGNIFQIRVWGLIYLFSLVYRKFMIWDLICLFFRIVKYFGW